MPQMENHSNSPSPLPKCGTGFEFHHWLPPQPPPSFPMLPIRTDEGDGPCPQRVAVRRAVTLHSPGAGPSSSSVRVCNGRHFSQALTGHRVVASVSWTGNPMLTLIMITWCRVQTKRCRLNKLQCYLTLSSFHFVLKDSGLFEFWVWIKCAGCFNNSSFIYHVDVHCSCNYGVMQVRNGHIKRITDNDIQSLVIEIAGTNVR